MSWDADDARREDYERRKIVMENADEMRERIRQETAGLCQNRTGGGRYRCNLTEGHDGKHTHLYPRIQWED